MSGDPAGDSGRRSGPARRTEPAAPTTRHARPTRERIIDAALDLFGARGVDSVSLDEIAGSVGVRKQTLLYWFASKDDLVLATVARTADELVIAAEAAARRAGAGFERIEALVGVVFRAAVRRPALLGLVRELHRLPPVASAGLLERLAPVTRRAERWLSSEMEAGRLRRADPAMLIPLIYATVVGAATEPVALQATGWHPGLQRLRHLRRELLAYLRAALV